MHYAYHPCDDAVLSLHELAGKNWRMQPEKRLMMHEISSGIDELGVLLMGHARGAYWYGSRLSIEEARRLVPHNNATSLQVTAAVLGGVIWALENPEAGIVDADAVDYARVMAIAEPYLGRNGGRLQRLEPARRPRNAVRGGGRFRVSMAVPQLPRGVSGEGRRGALPPRPPPKAEPLESITLAI